MFVIIILLWVISYYSIKEINSEKHYQFHNINHKKKVIIFIIMMALGLTMRLILLYLKG